MLKQLSVSIGMVKDFSSNVFNKYQITKDLQC